MPADKLANSLTNQLHFYEGTTGDVTKIRKVKGTLSLPATSSRHPSHKGSGTYGEGIFSESPVSLKIVRHQLQPCIRFPQP